MSTGDRFVNYGGRRERRGSEPTNAIPAGGMHVIHGNLVSDAYAFPNSLVDSAHSTTNWHSGYMLRQSMVALHNNIAAGSDHAGFTFQIVDAKDTSTNPRMVLVGVGICAVDTNTTWTGVKTLEGCSARCVADKWCKSFSFCDPAADVCGGGICSVSGNSCENATSSSPSENAHVSYRKSTVTHRIENNEAYSQKYGLVLRNRAGARELFRFKAWLSRRAGIVDFDENQNTQLREVVLADNYMGTVFHFSAHQRLQVKRSVVIGSSAATASPPGKCMAAIGLTLPRFSDKQRCGNLFGPCSRPDCTIDADSMDKRFGNTPSSLRQENWDVMDTT